MEKYILFLEKQIGDVGSVEYNLKTTFNHQKTTFNYQKPTSNRQKTIFSHQKPKGTMLTLIFHLKLG